jgi:extracellular factor (EF) 3-hydroxypalmitic acid methyl ester biosynthesis protein
MDVCRSTGSDAVREAAGSRDAAAEAGAESNLQLVLSLRERVRPEFRAWVADLVYDLSVYERYFEEREGALAAAAPDERDAALAAIVASEGRRFRDALRARDAELIALTRGYGPEEHERHGFYFRRMLWRFLLLSDIHRRTNQKPRGYAGDAEMMRLLYEEAPSGRSLLGKLLHQHAVGMRAADAVRNRRRLIPRVLREVSSRVNGVPRVRFLSVAAGPAWELRDLFAAPEDAERFECGLLDQDAEALEAARATVREIERERSIDLSVAYHLDSVRTMLRDRRLSERLGTLHCVYSMGLFDYLTPPVARAVLARLHALVAPGGTLVVGNYHVGNVSRVYMDYWCDWPLYYRTEPAFLALADGLDGTAEVTYDESGCQMFLRIDKPA